MKVEILPVWKNVTPALGEELMKFWRSNKAIADDSAAAARANQVICIARDEAGELCGVGTGVIKVLPRLRQPMYYYRQFFAPTLRGQHQELPFFQQAKQILQDYNASLVTPESLGILLELENSKIASAYTHAHEPSYGATFIGYSPRGLQLRVSYFDNAVLQPPAPLRRPGAATAATTIRDTPATPRRTSSRS